MTEILRGTSMETTESQTQPDQLQEQLTNYAEVESHKEAMSAFALAATQTVLGNSGDEDVKPVGLVTKSLRVS